MVVHLSNMFPLNVNDLPEEEVINEARAVCVVNKFFHYLCLTTDSINEICLKLGTTKRTLRSSVSKVFQCLGTNSNFQKLFDYARNFPFSLYISSQRGASRALFITVF